MTKKRAVLILILSIIIILVGYILIKRTNDISVNNNAYINLAKTIEINDITKEVEDTSKSINIQIPQFTNLESNFKEYINDKIYNELNDDTIYKRATEGYNEDEIGVFTYELYYDRYNFEDYISIVATQYIHLGDGRPRVTKKCYVINAKTNALVSLEDLFKDKTNYKEKILEEINNQADDLKIELIGGNGLKSLSNIQAFYIKDGKLIIYFEASEIAATAVGELEFEMPFKFKNSMI